MNLQFNDAQAALSFFTQQAQYIEAEVYRVRYPEIQYPNLMPVDSSGNEWVKSIAFFSIDMAGQAQWFTAQANDIPYAEIQRTKFEQGVAMAAIGYRYTVEEVQQQMMIPGLNLGTERANAAHRAAEEMIDRIAFFGDTTKAWTGLTNDANVTITNAPADGTGSSPLWSTKTADLIIRDINLVLTAVYTGSLTVETADTLLLSPANFTTLASARITNTTMSALQYLQEANAYTALTGNPLTIRTVRGLETAGAGGTIARAIVYRNDPQILKLHLPMPHQFRGVFQQENSLVFVVPGIFRTGGVEIRRPGAVRYLDGI